MAKETEYGKRVAAEVSRLQKEEDNKRFLMDKSIGGASAPRPSRAFIEKCVGALKSLTQIRTEAEQTVRKQQTAERADQQRRLDVERSMREQEMRIKAQREQRTQAQQQQRATTSKSEQVNDLANRLRQSREDRLQSRTQGRKR